MGRPKQNSSISLPHGRKRTVSPGFLTDSALLSLSPLHRIFFLGLWVYADRSGRLLDRPIDLKIRILPMDAFDPEQGLKDLAALGLIRRYIAGRERFIALKDRPWKEVQRIHPDEPESTIPPCPDGQDPEPRRRGISVHENDHVDGVSDHENDAPGISDDGNAPVDLISDHGKSSVDPLSGTGSSGSSGSSCLRDPRALEKISAARPAPPPLKLVGDPAPKQRKRSEAQRFRDWAESERVRVTKLVAGADPAPAQLNAWFARAIAEVGLERLKAGWARYLLRPKDAYWRERGFPLQGFMAENVWRQYVPAEASTA